MKLPLLLFAAAMTAFSAPRPIALRVSMISLGVTDMARSVKFYGETLGLTMTSQAEDVTLFRAGEVTIVLNRPLGMSAGGNLAGAVEVIFPAPSVSDMKKRLASRGCLFINEPHEVTPGAWAATFSDPDGHRLTLFGGK